MGCDQPAAHGPFLALQTDMSESPAYKKSVLIVEDEQSIRDVLVELFDVEGNVVSSAELLPEALERLRTQRFDFVVTDLRLGGKRDGGLQVLALAGMLSPDAMVLVLTAFPDDSNRQAWSRDCADTIVRSSWWVVGDTGECHTGGLASRRSRVIICNSTRPRSSVYCPPHGRVSRPTSSRSRAQCSVECPRARGPCR